jgi:hypothetical protein
MPRPRSLIVTMEWTIARRAHDCRNNRGHRIDKGNNRLTVKEDGDEHHYCVTCAKTFLSSDIKRLAQLLDEAEVNHSKAL